MHAYATDATDRKTAPIILAVIAILFALLLSKIFEWSGQQPPWYVDTPSVMGFYGLLWLLYDKHGWHLRFRSLRLSRIPDIRGTWKVTTVSTYKDGSGQNTQSEGVASIRQTWSKISIRLQFENSASSSTMASINTEESSDYGLNYEYLNEPEPHGLDTMQIHRGTAHLHLSTDGKTLKGGYYTGRGRMNLGSMALSISSKSLMTYEEAMGVTADPR
jgi:hypothetical protein